MCRAASSMKSNINGEGAGSLYVFLSTWSMVFTCVLYPSQSSGPEVCVCVVGSWVLTVLVGATVVVGEISRHVSVVWCDVVATQGFVSNYC